MRASIAHNNFRPRHAKTSRTIFKVSSDPLAKFTARRTPKSVHIRCRTLWTRSISVSLVRSGKTRTEKKKRKKKAFRAWILKRPARFAIFRENDDVTAICLPILPLSLSPFLSFYFWIERKSWRMTHVAYVGKKNDSILCDTWIIFLQRNKFYLTDWFLSKIHSKIKYPEF